MSEKTIENNEKMTEEERSLLREVVLTPKVGKQEDAIPNSSSKKKKKHRGGKSSKSGDKNISKKTHESPSLFQFSQKRALTTPEERSEEKNKKTRNNLMEIEDIDDDDIVDIEDTEPMNEDDESTPANARDALLTKRIAIIPTNYPDVIFNQDCMLQLEREVNKKIDEMSLDEPAPCFLYRRLERGFVKLACVGDFTVDWLKSVVSDWTFAGDPMRVIPCSELPKEPVYKVWIAGDTVPLEQLLSRIEKQNKEISTTDWRHRGGRKKDEGSTLFFALDPQSISTLKTRNFLLHFGMSQIKFIELTGNGSKPTINKKTTETVGNGENKPLIVESTSTVDGNPPK